MSGDKAHVRASERTARPIVKVVQLYPEHAASRPHRPMGARTDGRATDVEIAHLEKLARDLAMGMRNLRMLRPAPADLTWRMIGQAAKMRKVEAKLFGLRQGRLL